MKRSTVTVTFDARTNRDEAKEITRRITDAIAYAQEIGLSNTELSAGVIHEVSFTWDELSDLDKGAVLMFLHKVEYEGKDYARKNYPCTFLDHPELKELTWDEANDFALTFEDLLEQGVPGDDDQGTEHRRLYELARLKEG